MSFSNIVITFNDDFVDGEVLEIAYQQDANSTTLEYTCRTTPTQNRDFQEGTPTATAGEVSAQNYETAFNTFDVPSGLFTISRNVNEVTITATQINITFSNLFAGAGKVSVQVNNTTFNEVARVRSPFYINAPTNNGTIEPLNAVLELYIYNGNKNNDLPNNPTYTLTAEATNFGDNGIYFEVSELVRDFIEHNYIESATQCAWFKYDITTNYDGGTLQDSKTLLALDAFNFFADGINYKGELSNGFFEDAVLFSNNVIQQDRNNAIIVPCLNNSTSLVQFLNNGIEQSSEVPTETEETLEAIFYAEHDLNDGDIDEVRITNGNTGTVTSITYVDKIECKYNPIRCTFINRYGAKQYLDFMRANKERISVKKEMYRSNLLTSVNGNIQYNTLKHQYKNLNDTAREQITLNSGYYPEAYNDVFSELLLSNDIWLEIDGTIKPVIVKTSNLEYKTRINDKLISYTIDFEYANDYKNNVRQ